MCETDRDHRAASHLYVNGESSHRGRNGREMNGHHHHDVTADTRNAITQASREVGEQEPYKVSVSARFLITSLLASCLLAFCIGRAARLIMLGGVAPPALPEQCNAPTSLVLPSILAKNAKSIPQTRYSSKNFDTSMSVSSSTWLAASRDPAMDVDTSSFLASDTDVEQQPMAEHLMVDIKHVDSAFLNSEQRLANSIIEVMNEANLTLLSYHCHGLVPMGVSCVGVLLQNYISFHTWPEEGVITLDLCVGGPRSLLPVLPIIERAFGKPRSYGKKPEMRWAHRVRGFPTDGSASHDLGLYVLGDLATDVKKEVRCLVVRSTCCTTWISHVFSLWHLIP